jgi:hypothetical protein
MQDHFEFEKAYWNNCCNTFDEEQKHYVYARLMGIEINGYSFNANNKTILDWRWASIYAVKNNAFKARKSR